MVFHTLEKLGLHNMIADQSLSSLFKTNKGLAYSPTALCGTKLGHFRSTISVSQGAIDSYGSCYSSCGDLPNGTLVMMAGTSTCFIVSHGNTRGFIPGLWGEKQENY